MNKQERTEIDSTGPGYVVKEFMEAWLYQDYDKMYTLVHRSWADAYDREYLWDIYSGIIISDYEIVTPPPPPEAAAVQAEIRVRYNGVWLKPAFVNLVCETKTLKIRMYGEWGVNPISTLALIQRLKTRTERRKEERKKKK